ncbi:hypothetical protein H0H81_000978, partial [Sphagnurus paluster]
CLEALSDLTVLILMPTNYDPAITQNAPLQLLAQVAVDVLGPSVSQGLGSLSSADHITQIISPSHHTLHFPVHIDCTSSTVPKPLRDFSASNSPQSFKSSGRKKHQTEANGPTRKSARTQFKARADIKVRRRECLIRALKICTLDNSPVNDQQYAVLRTVYDEITMYPSEAWMVLIALVIYR